MIAIYFEKKSGRKDFVKSILNGSLRFSAFAILLTISLSAMAADDEIFDEGEGRKCVPVAEGCSKGGAAGPCTAKIRCSELLNPPPGQTWCEVDGVVCR